jgi:hypothetical protein
MEQTLRKLITDAVKQVHAKVYDVAPEDPVQAFLDDLFSVLFPSEQQVVTVPEVKPAAEKKPRAPRKKKEEEKPVEEGESEGEKPVEAETEAAPEKKKRAPRKKKEEEEGEKPVETEAAPAPEKKKPGRKPKETDANAKLTPTLKKKIKDAADRLKVAHPDPKDVLAYLNEMDKEAFNAQTTEKHLEAFLTPKEEEAKEAEVELETVAVPFNDKVYYVDEVSKRVYEEHGEAYEAVGYVGMAEFKDMKLPTSTS